MRFALPSLRSMVFGSTILMSTAICRLLLSSAAKRRLRSWSLRISSNGNSGTVSTSSSTWSSGPFEVRMIWYCAAISGKLTMTCSIWDGNTFTPRRMSMSSVRPTMRSILRWVRPHAHSSGMMRVTSRVR